MLKVGARDESRMTKPPGFWTSLGVRVQKHMTDMTIFSSREKVLKKFPSVSCNLIEVTLEVERYMRVDFLFFLVCVFYYLCWSPSRSRKDNNKRHS